MDSNLTLSKRRVLELLHSNGCDVEDFFSEYGDHPYYFESEVSSWVSERVGGS